MTHTEWRDELAEIRDTLPRCPYEADTALVVRALYKLIALLERVGENGNTQGDV